MTSLLAGERIWPDAGLGLCLGVCSGHGHRARAQGTCRCACVHGLGEWRHLYVCSNPDHLKRRHRISPPCCSQWWKCCWYI